MNTDTNGVSGDLLYKILFLEVNAVLVSAVHNNFMQINSIQSKGNHFTFYKAWLHFIKKYFQ